MAAALLADAQGRVLLGLRATHKASCPGCWDAPGGHLEPGETAEAAMVREVREELHVEALRWVLLGTVAFTEGGAEVPCSVYAVTAWTGEPHNACDEHEALGWFTAEEVGELPNLASPAYPALARRAVALATPTGLEPVFQP